MDKLTNVLEAAVREISSSLSQVELELVKSKYLGKAGIVSTLMQELKELPDSEKKEFGKLVNQIKVELNSAFIERKEFILQKELNNKLLSETIDVTLSGRDNELGSLHPISIVLNKMVSILSELGFDIADGPEIETDYYNFQALNIPDNHPARCMQDTFYIGDNSVLRTHTSPIQVRYAEKNKPAIKIIAPGRVYRVDMDKTHSPMFHQLEGLWIDKGINFANLKGVVTEFLRRFFNNSDLQIRFRASFFPFTEPSAEVDILSEDGSWLEVLGCGMVHPKVLHNMKINPEEYSGFAFGVGIDRFAMLKYGVHDLRTFFENDLDFLQQFSKVNEVVI